MIEGATNDNKKDKKPEEADNLNIPPADFVDCEECHETANNCSKGDHNQALPDVVN